jgi:hypothetical protein
MYIILHTDNFNIKNVFFSEREKNNVIQNCFFTHVLYSDKNITLNNLVFKLNIPHMEFIDKTYRNHYTHNNVCVRIYKIKVCPWIQKAIEIEAAILNLYNSVSQQYTIRYNLKQALQKGMLHITGEEGNQILRISGVWQDKMNNIGLIYKFITIHQPFASTICDSSPT